MIGLIGYVERYIYIYMGVSENDGTPKSSILIWVSIINHPFWGTFIFGNTHIYIYTTQTHCLTVLCFGQRKSSKSLKTFPASVRICWLDPSGSTVLLCTGTRTLQPFDFRRRNPKLPRFDLVSWRRWMPMGKNVIFKVSF